MKKMKNTRKWHKTNIRHEEMITLVFGRKLFPCVCVLDLIWGGRGSWSNEIVPKKTFSIFRLVFCFFEFPTRKDEQMIFDLLSYFFVFFLGQGADWTATLPLPFLFVSSPSPLHHWPDRIRRNVNFLLVRPRIATLHCVCVGERKKRFKASWVKNFTFVQGRCQPSKLPSVFGPDSMMSIRLCQDFLVFFAPLPAFHKKSDHHGRREESSE